MSEPLDRANLEGLRGAWLEHLMLRNLAPLTLRQMEQSIRLFMGYLKGRSITDAGQVDQEVFEQYKAFLSTGYQSRKGQQLHCDTVRVRLGFAQRWFAWLKKKGVLAWDPIAEVQLPRKEKRLPKGVLSPEEIRKVMEQPDLKTALGYRDRTMIEVLYSTGVRAAELLRLKVPDLDLKKKAVRIRNGKGGKDRFAPLSTPCCRFLARYLEAVRPELAACTRFSGKNWLKKMETGADYLFLSAYGGPFSHGWLALLMARYIRQAGITRPIQPVHGFRHSVATHLVADGMDVRFVQVLLGHNHITSTQVYTHVERDTLHRLLKAHHPRSLSGETVQSFLGETDGPILQPYINGRFAAFNPMDSGRGEEYAAVA